MKYCSKCGNELFDEAVICPKCGCAVVEHSQYNNTASNGMAVAGFVCAFFIPLFGWIFGWLGYIKSKELNGRGRELSIASMILAVISFILYTVVVILWIL